MRALMIMFSPFTLILTVIVISLLVRAIARLFYSSGSKKHDDVFKNSKGEIYTEAKEVERPTDGDIQDLDNNGHY